MFFLYGLNVMSFLKELKNFEKKSLSVVTTQVTKQDGRKVIESISVDGFKETDTGEYVAGFCLDTRADTEIWPVIDKLYISSQDGAHNLDELKAKNITHILNVATGVPNVFPECFVYKTVELLDLPETKLEPYFSELFDFIHQGCNEGAVLVHCNAGVSRSCSVIVAYMMYSLKMPLKEAMDIVKQARPSVSPNEGFMRQLREYDKILSGKHSS